MFKRSKRRIVVTVMSALILMWGGTLALIYTTSYFELSEQNKQMLDAHAAMYTLSSPPGELPPPSAPFPEPGFADSSRFQMLNFYTVALSYDGTVLETKNEPPTVYTDEELEEIAAEVVKDAKDSGREKNLLFRQTDKGGYLLVTFVDNTIVNESVITLFRYTLIFGAIAVVVFFLFAVFIAGKIVKPLEESDGRQRRFVSDAGHELKTPVSVIHANAELLSREIGANPWLDNIVYENGRMGRLITELLELTRTEQSHPQKERLDFSRLIQGEMLPFESVAFERGTSLKSSILPNRMVLGNSSQLKQLVSILLDNAIRYSDGSDGITLTLREEQRCAVLSVVNPGKEIPRAQREQLFERFYRGDTARTGEDDHYGLGLAIAKAIVLSHQGQIGVSCHDGLVEFTVKIPLL